MHEINSGRPDGNVRFFVRFKNALDVIGLGEHPVSTSDVKSEIVIKLNKHSFIMQPEQVSCFYG